MNEYKWTLVVDDQEGQVDIVTEYLNLLDIESAGVTNFAQFEKQYQQKVPDLVFLDISMPDYDAYHYIKWLSEQGCKSSLVFMSGIGHSVLHAAVMMAEKYNLHVLGHLNKPFTYRDFEACLRQ